MYTLLRTAETFLLVEWEGAENFSVVPANRVRDREPDSLSGGDRVMVAIGTKQYQCTVLKSGDLTCDIGITFVCGLSISRMFCIRNV